METPGEGEGPIFKSVFARLPRKGPPARYEERMFAFADILGFAELVETTKNDPIQLDQLKRVLDLISSYGDKSKPKKRGTSVWSMAFSDCVVMSEENSLRGFSNLLINLALLSWHMLGLGRLVRGAITSGLIYHRGTTVFGPALIEAYRLEREVAVYPRIIVANSLVSALDSLPSGYRSVEKEPIIDSTKMCRLLLRRDQDALYFVDYLNVGVKGIHIPFEQQTGGLGGVVVLPSGGKKEMFDHLGAVRSWLVKELSDRSKSTRPRDMKIMQKLEWFRHYFNAAIDEESV